MQHRRLPFSVFPSFRFPPLQSLQPSALAGLYFVMPILFDIRHHFNVHIKPTHPIWSSKENLERYERLYGGPIRPLDDIIEHLFLTTLLFGFKEVCINGFHLHGTIFDK